ATGGRRRACPGAATADSSWSLPATPAISPAGGGRQQEPGESTPLPLAPRALCLPAPAGVRPSADTTRPPRIALRAGPLRPTPRTGLSGPLRAVRVAHTPRPARRDNLCPYPLPLQSVGWSDPHASARPPLLLAPARPGSSPAGCCPPSYR